MTRAEKVVLVSIPKAGTHLAAKALSSMGYQCVWRLGEGLAGTEEYYAEAGIPSLGTIPSNTCLIVHRLDLETLNRRLFLEWYGRKDTAIVFHGRHPADVLLSLVSWMTGNRDDVLMAPSNLIQMDIMAQCKGRESQVDYVLDHVDRELGGPLFPMTLYRELRWLLLHPRIHKTSFERLVGAAGGGDDQAQTSELRALAEHLGAKADVEALAASLHGGTVTFRKGKLGDWLREMSPEQQRKLRQRFGYILDLYGYSGEGPADWIRDGMRARL